jgi:hypothetical protein
MNSDWPEKYSGVEEFAGPFTRWPRGENRGAIWWITCCLWRPAKKAKKSSARLGVQAGTENALEPRAIGILEAELQVAVNRRQQFRVGCRRLFFRLGVVC